MTKRIWPGQSWPAITLSAVAALLAAGLYAASWFEPASFPDTLGYLRAAASAEPWSQERHPLYGWLVLRLDEIGPDHRLMPALQYCVQAAAVLALLGGALRCGVSRLAALALGLSVLLSQGLGIWGRAVLPESLSVSLLLVGIAAALAAARGGGGAILIVVSGLAVAAACTLRPIMLPALAMVPLLHVFAARITGAAWRPGAAVALCLLAAAPLAAQSAWRWRAVGDFGLVSFGGFAISGMTSQLLTPDVLDRVPEIHRPLARSMLEAKERAVAEQSAMPLFRNSVGERSFRATALDGFDTLARNFDEIMWGKLTALRGADESWIAFNARMGTVNGAILRALPERWAFWAIGATSRLVGRLIAYNVAFVAAMALFTAAALVNLWRTGRALGGGAGRSWAMLVLIVATWVISTTALSVVTAFPALRYVDTGGMLMTALPLYGFLLALRKTSEEAPA